MKPAEIIDLFDRTPFVPFDIRTSDGRTYRVSHPDFIMRSKDGNTIYLQTDDDRHQRIDVHHIVFGDGVQGGRLYGAFPPYGILGSNQASQGIAVGVDTDTGRWIPGTSVDEYAATLAKWFGVSPANLPTIFPNLPRFPNPDLGFLIPPVPSAVPRDTVVSSQSGTPTATATQPPTKAVKPTKQPSKPAPVQRPMARKA